MTVQRIPILSSVDPENSSSNTAEASELAKNVMYDKYPEGAVYVTQRPGVTVTNKPEFVGREKRGRGAYNWSKNETAYQVINDTIYSDYTAEVGTISAGLNLVFFTETDNELVIIDPENNEGWIIDQFNVLTQITDGDFPPNQVPARQLAGGGAWLDGNMYVLDDTGTVWNSDDNDPSSWNGLGFIEAGRSEDGGVFLAPHADGIAVFGTRTIEFFYNAGNAVASPLGRRQDVFYNTGALDTNSVTFQGDRIYFIGSEESGTLGFYSLDQYRLNKLSTRSIDLLLSESRHTKELDFFLSGLMLRGHKLAFLSGVQGSSVGGYFLDADYLVDQEDYVLTDGTDLYATQFTLVFDETVGQWSVYDTSLLEFGGFPIISGTSKLRSKNTVASVLFLNGEIAEFGEAFTPVDQSVTQAYFDTNDYIVDQDDYILVIGENVYTAIPFTVRLPEWDGGTMTLKFCHRLELVGNALANNVGDTAIQVRWSDDHFNTFTPYRTLSTNFRQKLSRLGKFKRRSFEIFYDGLDPLRIEGVEIDVRASQYAR